MRTLPDRFTFVESWPFDYPSRGVSSLGAPGATTSPFTTSRTLVTELFGDAALQAPDPLLERLRSATEGTYDVVGELGRGGMAVVYAGSDRKLQRRVAIKVMDPRLSMTTGMAARFLQEARIAARLQHPNIIVVHDVRQSDEIIFFVMSLIDGVAVDALCRQPQPIPVDQIRWILLQAARSLAYAHSEEIVHRDIKPANILLNLKGEVILTDFGIAKALGDTGLTQSGTQVGTPMYMSPEQFSGIPVGPPSDQYALGVTAYQMIAGRPPFSGDLYQLIAAHGGKPPTPLRELRPDCPAFLANAVMRMLEKDPANRWPSLEDLQDVFGANMAMDGGVARRALAETVRTLRDAAGGNLVVGATSGPTSDASRRAAVTAARQSSERARESIVVTISPPGATIFVSGTLELRASVSLDTGQSLPGAGAQWTSSDESVLRVQVNGIVSGVAPGTAVVRASVGGGWSEATIRVEAAPIARLSLATPSITLRVGDVVRPEVIAVDVNGTPCAGVSMAWISRSPAVADLDAPGVIRAIAPGMAVIDVSTGNVRRSMDVAVLRRPIARLRVSATTSVLQLGDAAVLSIQAFDDLGTHTDATPVRWTSSAPSIIHIDSTGRALAIGPGVARISASIDEATDSVELQSLEPPVGSVQLTLTDERLELGDELVWSLRVKDVNGAARSASGVRVWSSAPDVLQVDDGGLKARALRIGEATLHAAPESDAGSPELGVSVRVVVTDVVVARVELFPATLDLEVGAVAAVNLQALDSRGVAIMSALAVWESDSPDVAVVEGNGIVRAMTLGACTIRARITNGTANAVEASVAVRVRAAAVARLSIAGDRSMLEAGEQMRLRATTFDAMDVELTDAVPLWRSLQPAIARVEGDGSVTALAAGRATIIVELDGKSGQISILVSPAAVESLSIEVPTTDVVIGMPVRLAIVARDRNGQSVQPPLQWVVEPANAATITPLGELTATRAGTLTVRASLAVPADATGILSARSALESTVSMLVRAPRVTALAFAATSVSMVVGRNARADVRATTDSGANAPASALQWASAHPDIVQVDANGELRAMAPGETQVTATAEGMRAALTVRVTVAVATTTRLKSMALVGGGIAVAALAWILWPASSPTIAEGPGDTSVVAKQDSAKPSLARTLTSLSLTPTSVEVAKGKNQQFSVAATWSDGSTSVPSVTFSANGGQISTDGIYSAGTSEGAYRVIVRADSLADTSDVRVANVVTQDSQNSINREADKREVDKREVDKRGADKRGADKREADKREADKREADKRESDKRESDTRESDKREADKREIAKRDSVARENAKRDASAEAPSTSELRTIADRIASDVRSGKSRPTADLKQFFADGAEHKVTIKVLPVTTPLEQGQMRTQFELELSRYNSGGAQERRLTVVQIHVAKRGGAAELLSTSFGPLVKPGSR